MSKKNKDNYQEFFLTTLESEVESPLATNLSVFSTHLGYLSALVTGGKMTPEDAEKRVKDLYKVWKRSNKAIGDELS